MTKKFLIWALVFWFVLTGTSWAWKDSKSLWMYNSAGELVPQKVGVTVSIGGSTGGGLVTVGETSTFEDADEDSAVVIGWTSDDNPLLYVTGNASSLPIANLALSFPFTFTEDSGAVSVLNMGVSVTPAAGAEMSMAFRLDSDNILKLYSEADSAGGINTKQIHAFGNLVFIPVSETVSTEADLSDPLESSLYLITGDNDGDNDVVQLQNGQTAGQAVFFIAEALIDVDDTITIDTTTDSTCTNCPAIVFNKIGENATLVWTGTTWSVVGIQDSL